MRHLLRRSAQTAGTGAIQVRCLMCRFGTGGAWEECEMSTLRLEWRQSLDIPNVVDLGIVTRKTHVPGAPPPGIVQGQEPI
jgi:hypothetical protein